jgi:hypothetical protein
MTGRQPGPRHSDWRPNDRRPTVPQPASRAPRQPPPQWRQSLPRPVTPAGGRGRSAAQGRPVEPTRSPLRLLAGAGSPSAPPRQAQPQCLKHRARLPRRRLPPPAPRLPVAGRRPAAAAARGPPRRCLQHQYFVGCPQEQQHAKQARWRSLMIPWRPPPMTRPPCPPLRARPQPIRFPPGPVSPLRYRHR